VYHGSKEHIFWVHGLKYKILGFFHLQYEIYVRHRTVMLYVRNLGLLPDDDHYGPMAFKGLKIGIFEFIHHQYKIPNR
jgi:hypothetical protein